MNKKIAIITDSGSDLNDKFAKKYNIKIIPLRMTFSNNIYRDRVEITSNEFYELLEKEIPKTSLPSVKDILCVLDSLKAEGYTDVLYVGISSAMSGTLNFVDIIGHEYEGLNFYSFDSRTLACAQRVLVIEAIKELERSGDIDRIKTHLFKIRQEMTALLTVGSLKYLYRGGRISRTASTVGNLLHINPIITVNDKGKFEVIGKSIGVQRAIDSIIKDIKSNLIPQVLLYCLSTNSIVIITNDEITIK